MSFVDGKVNDYFDREFDFNRNGELDMEEQAMQFDFVTNLGRDSDSDDSYDSYDSDDSDD